MRFYSLLATLVLLFCSSTASIGGEMVEKRNQYFSYGGSDLVITDTLYREGKIFRVHRVVQNRSTDKEVCVMIGDEQFNLSPYGLGSVILMASPYFLNTEARVLLCAYNTPEGRDRCG